MWSTTLFISASLINRCIHKKYVLLILLSFVNVAQNLTNKRDAVDQVRKDENRRNRQNNTQPQPTNLSPLLTVLIVFTLSLTSMKETR